MKRTFLSLPVILLLAAPPIQAGEIEENEPMVMRLIFTDCLGYIRNDKTPFQGLATRPASAEAIDTLNARLPDRDKAIELLSPRYVAAWGADNDARYCTVQTVWDGKQPYGTGLLGVRPTGFIERVTERAAAVGISERDPGEEFSPTTVMSWYEPDTGYETGPMRPIRFAVLPTNGTDDGSLVDVGLIIMGGPPLTKP